MIKHLCASNDLNGNPQRCYVLVDEDGEAMAAWDEGYMGSNAVPGVWRREAYSALRSEITVKEYKRLLKTLPSPDYGSEVKGYEHLKIMKAL
jgi:hypothetical protein